MTTSVSSSPHLTTTQTTTINPQSSNKFVSRLTFFDPESKDSVLQFIRINPSNYYHASEELKMDFDVVKLMCDLDEYAFPTMEGNAKKNAMLYVSNKQPTRFECFRSVDDKYATWPTENYDKNIKKLIRDHQLFNDNISNKYR